MRESPSDMLKESVSTASAVYTEDIGLRLRTRILLFLAPIFVFCVSIIVEASIMHGPLFQVAEKLATYSLIALVFLLPIGLTAFFYSGKIEIFPNSIRLTSKSFYLQRKELYEYPKSAILDCGIAKMRTGRSWVGAITDHTLVGAGTDTPMVELRPWVKIGPGTMSGDGVALSIQNEKRVILILSRNPEELLKMIKA